jgi:hypothetical protein
LADKGVTPIHIAPYSHGNAAPLSLVVHFNFFSFRLVKAFTLCRQSKAFHQKWSGWQEQERCACDATRAVVLYLRWQKCQIILLRN